MEVIVSFTYEVIREVLVQVDNEASEKEILCVAKEHLTQGDYSETEGDCVDILIEKTN